MTLSAARRLAVVGPSWASLARNRGDLIASVRGLRHQVLCIAPEPPPGASGEHVRRLQDAGAECTAVPMPIDDLHFFADRSALGVLSGKIADWQPHVTLAYGPKSMLLGAVAARQARVSRIALLMTDLGEQLAGPDPPPWRWNRLARSAFGCAAVVIAHNRSDLRRLESLALLRPGADTLVVPGAGVDLRRFNVQPLPPFRGGLTFLMIAPLRRDKGVLEFCMAARKLRLRGEPVRFILAGSWVAGPGALSRSDLAAFETCVDIRGDHDDVRPLFADAHVVVLPSWREGMSRTLQEALASARPAIASNVPGCREAVDERVNGILVPPRDPDALADVIASVVERPELLPAMARASRLKAERWFDVHAVNADIIRALDLA